MSLKTDDRKKRAHLAHSDLWQDYWRNPESGDAVSRLVEAFSPYVHRVLGRMAIQLPSHLAMEDLLQAAMVGLYQAIERYNPDRGVGFESFAYRRIRGAILDELRSLDYVSRSSRAKIRRVEAALQEWLQQHGAPPTEQELADVVGMEREKLALLLDEAQPWLSLDESVIIGDQRNISRQEMLADTRSVMPDAQAVKKDLLHSMRHAFLELDAREQKMLYLYYYEELRLSEIAAIYELSEARICQIHALAMAKLKAILQRQEQE
jgi:RNA polymerase sigma factor for flagellar operon FliA